MSYYNKKYFQDRDLLDRHLAATIEMLAQEHGLKKILDVGCGAGKLVKYFNDNDFDAMGCDKFPEAIKIAKIVNNSSSIQQAPATNLPFKNHSFDLVTAISVIEHLTENGAKLFLAEAKRVLKPNGFLFMVTPNFAAPWRHIQGKRWFGYSDPTHTHFYTRKSLSGLLKSHEFNNIKFQFKTIYDPPYEWEPPGLLGKLPRPAKSLITFLLISTPVSAIRNSFWIVAQKSKKEAV